MRTPAQTRTALITQVNALSGPPVPEDEVARMDALERFGLRNMVRDARFDQLARVTADVLDMPISLATIIDSAFQCYAGAQGLDLSRTPREASFCAYTILGDVPMIVPDATRDHRFRGSPLVTGPPFIRFYAGVPLHAGGMRVGSLCAIDTEPCEMSEGHLRRLESSARVGEQLIESRLDALLRAEYEDRLSRFIEIMLAPVERGSLINDEDYFRSGLVNDALRDWPAPIGWSGVSLSA